MRFLLVFPCPRELATSDIAFFASRMVYFHHSYEKGVNPMKQTKLCRALRKGFHSLALLSLVWLGLELKNAPDAMSAAAAAEPVARRTAAYAYDRPSLRFSDADAENLDQLNFSFGLIVNGEVSGAHWSSIKRFEEYVQRHPHILPVLSVGGWGADGFSDAVASAQSRERFAQSAVKLMEKHGFLGLDIDWEYPGSTAAGIKANAKDTENYTLLLQALRDALDALTLADGKPRLLAIAVSGSPAQIATLDARALGAIVDQVNVMTYDLQTAKVASHHAPLYGSAAYPLSADSAVKACLSAGFPASKLMVGCAFYGHVFTLKEQAGKPFEATGDAGQKTLTYRQIVADAGWTTHFDESAKASYATKGKQFLTYDDETSIRSKGAYAAQNGLMGLMCWEYGGDTSGALLEAMREGLR